MAFCLSALGQDGEAPRPRGPGFGMDYGPFLACSPTVRGCSAEGETVALKGVVVRLGKDRQGTVCFDTESAVVVAGWLGGFLDLTKTHLTSSKGQMPPGIPSALAFRAHAAGKRPSGERRRYRGLYLHGNDVVFSYRMDGCEVLDFPKLTPSKTGAAFVRSFLVGPSRTPVTLPLAHPNPALRLTVRNQPEGATLEEVEGIRTLRLPPRSSPSEFSVVFGDLEAGEGDERANLEKLCRGGPARWSPIVTRGRLGTGDGAYVVDTLALPGLNPWDSWIRPSGLDFFSDGRLALCTWSGDVWVLSGIDGKLEELTWRRYATGLYEPMGLRVVEDRVYVLGRDQITLLHDLNGDGEADYYENFNNDSALSANYHAFAFDLHTDPAGNFYYARDGHRVDSSLPHHGSVLRVSKDGQALDVFATGFRAPNGMAVGPRGEVTVSDNQGNWIPTSKISWVRKGEFYGYVPHAGGRKEPRDFDPPLCWIPHGVDNSSGGQVWVTSDRWGPFQGHLLHFSYGKASLFHVLTEDVGGRMQGGVDRFPLTFDSGIMRGRFSPQDGQLYVCGLRGWQTVGARDGALHRVRFTGRPVRMPLSVSVLRGGLRLSFTDYLDPSTVSTENFALDQWSYRWSGEYGSPESSVAQPDRRGRDAVDVTTVRLEADGRTVHLGIPRLEPVMQMRIRARLKTAGGAPIDSDVYYTIHRIP